MATRKVTVTLEAEQLLAIQRLVAEGKASSVSGFVKHAVSNSLAEVAGWGAALSLALQESGGPLTRRERAWADEVLRAAPPPRARKRKAA